MKIVEFQITVTAAVTLAAFASFFLIGIPLLTALVVADLVFTILAASAAYSGREYRYPATFRFVR